MHLMGAKRSGLVAAAFLGALLWAPVAAQALPFQTKNFNLTGVALGGCNVNNTSSCVFVQQSEDYPDPTQLSVTYDLGSLSGNLVDMTIDNLFIPTINPGGGITPEDAFSINGGAFGAAASVAGTFNISTGAVSISFNLKFRRDTTESDTFVYTMTTGANTVPVGPCGSSPDTKTGLDQNPGTNAISIIGNQCVDILPGASQEWHVLAVSLTGNLPEPNFNAIPEPGALALLGLGLTVLATRRSRA